LRQLSANIAPLLTSDSGVEMFYLVRITAKTGAVILTSTTHYDDITLSNGHIFEANGLIVSADPPQLSTTVDREQYRVTLSDPEFLQGTMAEIGLVGKVLEVRLGFIDPATGLPFTNVLDTFIMYRGRLEGSSYKVDTNEFGEALLQMTGVSPILSLDMRRGLTLSKDAARQRNAQDTCCDQILEGASSVVLKWGR
jgi:hypothetical protein